MQLGTYGTVLGEYSDTRLVVRFDQRMDGLEQVREDENGELGVWNEQQKPLPWFGRMIILIDTYVGLYCRFWYIFFKLIHLLCGIL